jgi:hypothetical protein
MTKHAHDQTAPSRKPARALRDRSPDGDVATTPSSLVGPDRAAVVRLQRLIGNQAVHQLLVPAEHNATDPGQAAVNKTSPGACDERAPEQSGEVAAIQRDEGEFEERPNQDANLARLEMLLAINEARHQDLDNYASTMTRLAEVIFDQLSILSSTYTTAYNNFRQVINAAEAEAQNQQWWTDFIVDIVCGVVAGLIGGAYISESSKVILQIGKKAITRSEVGLAVITSAGGESAASGVGKTGLLEIAGQRIDTSALHPAIREVELWKNTARIYAASQQFSGFRSDLHDRVLGISQFITDVERYGAGREVDFTPEGIGAEVDTLEIEDEDWMWVNDDLPDYVNAAEQAVDSAFQIDAASVSARDIERTIWLLWISGLDGPYVLDLSAIEEHIGPDGLRLVDFGDYTSGINEMIAWIMARQLVEAAKSDLANLGSLDWGDFPLGVNPSPETLPDEGTTGEDDEEHWSHKPALGGGRFKHDEFGEP